MSRTTRSAARFRIRIPKNFAQRRKCSFLSCLSWGAPFRELSVEDSDLKADELYIDGYEPWHGHYRTQKAVINLANTFSYRHPFAMSMNEHSLEQSLHRALVQSNQATNQEAATSDM